MLEPKKHALYIACGDARLWESHTQLRKQLIEEEGLKLYNLLIPGPDEGANGHKEHFEAVVYLLRYFDSLAKFEKIIFVAHHDCAGCRVADEKHRELIVKNAHNTTEGVGYAGEVSVYVQQKPVNDEYAFWKHEAIAA